MIKKEKGQILGAGVAVLSQTLQAVMGGERGQGNSQNLPDLMISNMQFPEVEIFKAVEVCAAQSSQPKLTDTVLLLQPPRPSESFQEATTEPTTENAGQLLSKLESELVEQQQKAVAKINQRSPVCCVVVRIDKHSLAFLEVAPGRYMTIRQHRGHVPEMLIWTRHHTKEETETESGDVVHAFDSFTFDKLNRTSKQSFLQLLAFFYSYSFKHLISLKESKQWESSDLPPFVNKVDSFFLNYSHSAAENDTYFDKAWTADKSFQEDFKNALQSLPPAFDTALPAVNVPFKANKWLDGETQEIKIGSETFKITSPRKKSEAAEKDILSPVVSNLLRRTSSGNSQAWWDCECDKVFGKASFSNDPVQFSAGANVIRTAVTDEEKMKKKLEWLWLCSFYERNFREIAPVLSDAVTDMQKELLGTPEKSLISIAQDSLWKPFEVLAENKWPLILLTVCGSVLALMNTYQREEPVTIFTYEIPDDEGTSRRSYSRRRYTRRSTATPRRSTRGRRSKTVGGKRPKALRLA